MTHLHRCRCKLLAVSRVSCQIWEDLNLEGSRLQDQGLYRMAEKAFLQAHSLAVDQFGQNDVRTAVILHNLAALYATTGKYTEAERRLKETLVVLEDKLGDEHPLVARNLSNLGVLYYKLTRCKEAEPLFQRALAILEKTYAPENARVAVGLTNLATVYAQLGDYPQAESLFRRALSILKTSRSQSPYLATVDQNLGALYLRQGDYLQAETYCHRALEGMEKAYGPDHPDVAGALRAYAAVLRKERRKAEAKKLEKRAALIERRHSREKPDGTHCRRSGPSVMMRT
jgi:tetratricopeptide (TPR) repeat protein